MWRLRDAGCCVGNPAALIGSQAGKAGLQESIGTGGTSWSHWKCWGPGSGVNRPGTLVSQSILKSSSRTSMLPLWVIKGRVWGAEEHSWLSLGCRERYIPALYWRLSDILSLSGFDFRFRSRPLSGEVWGKLQPQLHLSLASSNQASLQS